MNTFHSCVAVATAFLVLAGFTNAAYTVRTESDDKPVPNTDDTVDSDGISKSFKTLFASQPPLPTIMPKIFNGDAKSEAKHLKYIQQFIDNGSDLGTYASEIRGSAEGRLNEFLQQLGFQGTVDIADYINALIKVEDKQKIDDPKVNEAVNLVAKYLNEAEKRQADSQANSQVDSQDDNAAAQSQPTVQSQSV